MFKPFGISALLVFTMVTAYDSAADTADKGSGVVKKIRVGLLVDAQCTDGKSREAAWRVLSESPDLAADRISTEVLKTERLKEYDVIVFPGGSGGGQASLLGVDGGQALTNWVKGGKGVIAICAGGYLIGEGWNAETSAVELINATIWDSGRGRWARGEQFIAVKTLSAGTAGAEPTTGTQDIKPGDETTSKTMWFENGPLFVKAAIPGVVDYTPLVRYVTDLTKKGAPTGMMEGRDAVVAAPFGKGRVVAFGPHPELSPGLNHWLVNATRWVAAENDNSPPTVEAVLEGKSQ